jgi:hypothetical protein
MRSGSFFGLRLMILPQMIYPPPWARTRFLSNAGPINKSAAKLPAQVSMRVPDRWSSRVT